MQKEIIPAIMPASIHDIESAAVSVRHVAQTIQLDLMDGTYVPESTWPFTPLGSHDLRRAQQGDFELALWEEIDYELDLMVAKPEEDLETYISLGASRIIFHFGSVHRWEAIEQLDPVTRNFLEIGVAVTIYDDLNRVFPLIENKTVDFIQVMGIARIGFQGEPFDTRCLEVIQRIKERYPTITISVDGGVSETTIPLLNEAGVTRFVSGSSVFGYGMADENVEYLYTLLEA